MVDTVFEESQSVAVSAGFKPVPVGGAALRVAFSGVALFDITATKAAAFEGGASRHRRFQPAGEH